MKNGSNRAQWQESGARRILYTADILNSDGKKRYIAPILERQAHLRDITLGSSPGTTESGGLCDPLLETCGGLPVPGRDSKKDSSGGSGIFENDIFGG